MNKWGYRPNYANLRSTIGSNPGDPMEGIAQMIESNPDPNDENIISCRGKLEKNDEEFNCAYIRILKNKNNGRYRIVARTSDGSTCIANHYILTEAIFKTEAHWSAMDYSDPNHPEMCNYILYIARLDIKEEFMKHYNTALSENKLKLDS